MIQVEKGIIFLSASKIYRLRVVGSSELYVGRNFLPPWAAYFLFPSVVLSITAVFERHSLGNSRRLVDLNESRGEANYALRSRQTIAIQNREL